jgi:GH24 family phage-related lysozyme (muramidase)
MTSKFRIAVAAVSLSASGMAGIALHENFVDTAMIPVVGDPHTVGYGSTRNIDGTPVKPGQRVNPAQALSMLAHHIRRDEVKLRECVKGLVSQKEWDLLVDHSYQYGVAATCSSSVVRKINAGDHAGACDAYLMWKKVRGFDCSTPGNTLCPGVWTRTVARSTQCKAEVKRIDMQAVLGNSPGQEANPEPTESPKTSWPWLAGFAALVLAGAAGFAFWRLRLKKRQANGAAA